MADDDLTAHEEWLLERCPNEAGAEHWWGWVGTTNENRGDIFWLHRCEGKLQLGTIDVTTPKHQLISTDPLHVEPSILCGQCGDHGYLRDGRWESV